MQKTLLKSIISRQSKEKDDLLKLPYIERSKARESQELISSDLIKVVLGPRRAGKSVFLLMLLKDKQFIYFNFDDPALMVQKLDPNLFIDLLHQVYGDTKYLLFDEIQNLPNWELFVNSLHRRGYNLFLTGSNANLLSMELATHLTGRHLPIEMFPFDFKEFLRAKNYDLEKSDGDLSELLEQFMISGGFPEVVIKNQQPHGYLDVLFDAVLFKDVVKRHNVRFPEQMDYLSLYLINNISNRYSFRKLANILNFKSNVTLERYLSYLMEAYLVFSLSGFSAKVGQRIKSPKKIYMVDNGFITAKTVQQSPNKGGLMENLVFTELLKRGYQPNRDLFYYNTRNNREVDFLLKEGSKVSELVQVCYELNSLKVKEREIEALRVAGEELNVDKLAILTWDEEGEIEDKKAKIRLVPLWKYLLGR